MQVRPIKSFHQFAEVYFEVQLDTPVPAEGACPTSCSPGDAFNSLRRGEKRLYAPGRFRRVSAHQLSTSERIERGQVSHGVSNWAARAECLGLSRPSKDRFLTYGWSQAMKSRKRGFVVVVLSWSVLLVGGCDAARDGIQAGIEGGMTSGLNALLAGMISAVGGSVLGLPSGTSSGGYPF
jgi:hypothetical protein